MRLRLFGPLITVSVGLVLLVDRGAMAAHSQLRASVSGVIVPVVVRDRERAPSGLSSTDFVLKDSGVVQDVQAVDGVRMPIDLSLVVDNTENAQVTQDRYRKALADIKHLLNPEDRVRIRLASLQPVDVVALSSPEAIKSVTFPPPEPAIALYDTVASVLLLSSTDRRHVVILASVGRDLLSVVGSSVLSDLARRSSAEVHFFVTTPTQWGTRDTVLWPVGAYAGWDWEPERHAALQRRESMTERQRLEADERDRRERLAQVAAATGGTEIRSNMLTGSITGPVQRILDEARSSYILYYTPKGVPEAGWHPITVTMKDPAKKYEIRARPGFMR